MSNPCHPPKPLCTCRLYKDAPTQVYPFKTAIGNCFTSFDRDKVNQNERTEKFVPIERREKLQKKQLMKWKQIILINSSKDYK